jgi:hypothetical protein
MPERPTSATAQHVEDAPQYPGTREHSLSTAHHQQHSHPMGHSPQATALATVPRAMAEHHPAGQITTLYSGHPGFRRGERQVLRVQPHDRGLAQRNSEEEDLRLQHHNDVIMPPPALARGPR